MFFAGNGTTYGHGVTYNNVSVGIKATETAHAHSKSMLVIYLNLRQKRNFLTSDDVVIKKTSYICIFSLTQILSLCQQVSKDIIQKKQI